MVASGTANAAVNMRGIVKRFAGGVLANNGVDFNLSFGEIHGLLGENGAGKTTLMNILYGLYQADAGSIFVFDKKVAFRSPADAIKAGIGMVHQHFKLVSNMTVTENIILGLKFPKGFLIDLESARTRILKIEEEHGLKVDPEAQIWQLAAGERQRVEILKALYRDAKILILDEPTSVLAPTEIKGFFNSLRALRSAGISIVLITHKLDEVMQVTDRISVLRKGVNVATALTSEVDESKLARLMVGGEIPALRAKERIAQAEPVLRVRNLRVYDDRGLEAVKGITFDVARGEILGIAGVSGNGQRELVEAIVGLRKPSDGSITVKGINVAGKPPRSIIDLGVAYVPENRTEAGSISDFGLDENLILKDFNKPPICKTVASRPTMMNDEEISRRAERAIKEFGITATGRSAKARTLSGGNLQRLILARELSGNPSLIVVSQPTSGLDISATEYVQSLLIEQRNRGTAVLLVDEDITELLALSDRIAVMYKGRIVGILDQSRFDPEQIGLLMTGAKNMPIAA